MSIIEALSSGFSIVTRRLWLMLIPVGLDLYLWLGPRISIEPLMKRLEPLLTAPPAMALSKTDAQALAVSRDALMEIGKSFNLLSLLVNSVLGVPSLTVISPTDLPPGRLSVVELSSGWGAMGLFILFSLCSVFIASLYLGLIAQQVRDGAIDLKYLGRRVWVFWGRIVFLGIILVVLIILLTLPFSLMSAMVAIISQGLALAIVGAFTLVALWVAITAMIYLFFAVDAILLNDVGIFQAIRNSVMVVRRNLWATVGLIILTNVIAAGLSLVWQQLVFASWGVAIGILGNAYIGSGLVASVLIFYKDRYHKWQEEMQSVTAPAPRVSN